MTMSYRDFCDVVIVIIFITILLVSVMRLLLISSSYKNFCLPVLNAARVSRGHSDESSSKLLLPGLCRGIKPKASHEMKATQQYFVRYCLLYYNTRCSYLLSLNEIL